MSPSQSALRLVVPAHEARRDKNSDRRAHHRSTLAELPWLRELRLKYGPRAVVIDLSSGGAQLEMAGFRLYPGSTVVVEINGSRHESPIPSRVIRCQISGLAPQLVYRAALEFKRTLTLPSAAARPFAAEANAAHEHARLLNALRRLDAAASTREAPVAGRIAAGGAALDALAPVLAMIDTPAARRAGRTFSREVAALFALVADAIENGAAADTIVDALLDRVRRTIPVRAIRLADSLAVSNRDAIYFDVPTTGPQSATKLVVEFPQGFRSEEWQFQYLKAAARFFAFASEIADAHDEPEQAPAENEIAAAIGNQPAARAVERMTRVVVRYLDGRLLKGYAPDFMPSRGAVEVWQSPGAPPASRVSVPLRQLKAIFFVRDFDGGTYAGPGAASSTSRTWGRKVIVTFLDGEELIGTTLNYQPAARGFFIQPLDDTSNNTRVYALSQAIRHVQFP